MRPAGLALALLVAALPAAAQDAAPDPSAPAALTSYRYALSFTLGLPQGWLVQDDAGFARLLAFSPADSLGDGFRENVNVTVEGLYSDSLDVYWAQSRAAIAESMAEFEEREAGAAEIAGLPARRIVYEHTFETQRLRVLAYLVFAPDRAYFLTATAPVQSYGDFGQTFERILNSFRPSS